MCYKTILCDKAIHLDKTIHRNKTIHRDKTSTPHTTSAGYKILTMFTLVLLLLTAGCSTLNRVVYRPDINQGNYLTSTDVAKLHTGMTQQQVVYTLGTPLLTDPFGSNTWYYIFRQQPGHKSVTQQTLTLTFDSNGTLTHIDNKPQLAKK